MPAPKGNKFWLERSSSGRNPIFSEPQKLWDCCCEYFQWVEENPLYESKMCSYQGKNELEDIPKMRAMTIDGLCLFLDICRKTWVNYGEKEDFLAVTSRVENVIKSQKFAGAAADLLNPNIIARDLGLVDKRENDNTGVIGIAEISTEEYKEARKGMIEKDDC